MAEEKKKKTRFERIYDKLNDEEKEFIAELPDKERAETLDFLINPLPVEPRIAPKEVRRILRKELKTPLELTEEEVELVYKYPELVRKAHKIDPIFFDITAKLTDAELEEFLYAAIMRPDLFKPPKIPVPPVVPEKARLPLGYSEAPSEVEQVPKGRVSKKWRAAKPFSTGLYIRDFLVEKGKKGAYPSEVYRAFRKYLIHEITALDGLEIEASGRTKRIKQIFAEFHVPERSRFYYYFHVLRRLGLIKRKGRRRVCKEVPCPAQYYLIVDELKESKMWEHFQISLYPMVGLGKRRWERLKERAEMEDIPIEEAFVNWYPRLIEKVAEERGIPVEELEDMIIRKEYT